MTLRRFLQAQARYFLEPRRELRRPTFDVDTRLEDLRREKHEQLVRLGVQPKPLLESQPDSFVRPVDVPEDFYPIG